jgi:hypothetical protein
MDRCGCGINRNCAIRYALNAWLSEGQNPPYETVQEQTDWFDRLPISATDRRKISRVNALQLLRLSSQDA